MDVTEVCFLDHTRSYEWSFPNVLIPLQLKAFSDIYHRYA